MRVSVAQIAGVCLLTLLVPLSKAESPSSSKEANSDSRHTAPLPAAPDTSMLTGNGLNTTPWPIDKVTPGGVMRKPPGTREWVSVRSLDPQMQQAGKAREAKLRLRANELRNIEIVIPDSAALRRLLRSGIADSCAPPCTLATRVLRRQLPQLASDSLDFWDAGDRNSLPSAQRRLRTGR